MGFFNLFSSTNINDGIEKMRKTNKAVLLDVRTKDEYIEAHIPDSINIPLNELEKINQIVSDKGTPLFVYCLSGGRSRQAAAYLKRLGYSAVTDIGGINRYTGNTEKGAVI